MTTKYGSFLKLELFIDLFVCETLSFPIKDSYQ